MAHCNMWAVSFTWGSEAQGCRRGKWEQILAEVGGKWDQILPEEFVWLLCPQLGKNITTVSSWCDIPIKSSHGKYKILKPMAFVPHNKSSAVRYWTTLVIDYLRTNITLYTGRPSSVELNSLSVITPCMDRQRRLEASLAPRIRSVSFNELKIVTTCLQVHILTSSCKDT